MMVLPMVAGSISLKSGASILISIPLHAQPFSSPVVRYSPHSSVGALVRTLRSYSFVLSESPDTTSRATSRPYGYRSDLLEVGEYLDELELLDAAGQGPSEAALQPSAATDSNGSRSSRRTSRKNYFEETLTTDEVHKKLAKAGQAEQRGKYWGNWYQRKAKELEGDVVESFGPQVQQYLKSAKQKRVEWEIVRGL